MFRKKKTRNWESKSFNIEKRIISSIALIIFVGFVYGFGLIPQQEESAGKKIFVDSKCGSCHSIGSVSITAKVKQKNAPDLSDVGNRHKANFITKFITKQEKQNDKLHPSAFKGTDEDLQTLAKWLESLNVSKEG